MKVPFLALDRIYKKHKDDYLRIVDETWSTGKMAHGSKIKDIEQRVAQMCNRKYGIATASCTDALYFALRLYNIGEDDEVIVTSFSFIASVTCITRVGATPIFIDIDEESFMMDYKKIEDSITDKTKAIIVVQLSGQSLQMKEIENIAQKNKLIIIEDAAQSFGALHNNRPVGNMGDISCISFDPLKTIGSFGFGGILLTDNIEDVERVDQLRNHGRKDVATGHVTFGHKSKMASIDAGVLDFRLSFMNEDINTRNSIATIYNNSFRHINEIITPKTLKGNIHTWNKYIIRVEKRDELKKYLKDNGIETKTWTKPMYDEPMYRYLNQESLNRVESMVKDNIGLPIFTDMTEEEIYYVANKVMDFYS